MASAVLLIDRTDAIATYECPSALSLVLAPSYDFQPHKNIANTPSAAANLAPATNPEAEFAVATADVAAAVSEAAAGVALVLVLVVAGAVVLSPVSDNDEELERLAALPDLTLACEEREVSMVLDSEVECFLEEMTDVVLASTVVLSPVLGDDNELERLDALPELTLAQEEIEVSIVLDSKVECFLEVVTDEVLVATWIADVTVVEVLSSHEATEYPASEVAAVAAADDNELVEARDAIAVYE